MNTNTNNGRVPFVQKMAFGAGHLVNNLFPGALGVFSFFLLTAFGIDPIYAGLLSAIPRFIDALSDPIIGFISDNTHSRWGRRRPFIFVGAILCGLFFIVQWQMDEKNGTVFNFWYFLICSILFILFNAIFATPLIGLGYEMTSDYKERTRLMGFSQTISQLAWMIVPWFWVLIADKNLFANQAEGVRKLSIVVGLICIVLGVLPALFCKEENTTPPENQAKLNLKNAFNNLKHLMKDMKNMSKNNPFMRLCGATFLVFNGFQMVSSFSFFIIVFYMFNGSYEQAGTLPAWFATISALATAFLVIPIVTFLANKFGKKNAFVISTIISIVGYVLKWWGFNPENPYMIFMPVPFIAFGLGGLFTLMMSMTADVCDLDELRNGLPRREGTFGAVYWWMVKLGQALALAIGGFVLEGVGFDQNAKVQSIETMHNLRIWDIIIPSVTAGLAILVMWNYDLSEERAIEIKKELEKRRAQN
ncbi:MFS transporter [Flavobacterium croceum]|uniref:MFS transporter n=1 Tax=Flavobacterium croceum TaxID=370975 RepID=UPI0024A9DE63|nr:MFS transporter [Flavobacterium croceum]